MTDPTTNAHSFRPPAWLRTALIGRRPKRTLARIVVLVVAVFLAPGLCYVVGDNRSMREKLHEKGKLQDNGSSEGFSGEGVFASLDPVYLGIACQHHTQTP